MAGSTERYKTSFIAGVIGTAVVALCCLTPVLVIVFGIVGLAALTPYLDYVLLPALVVLPSLLGLPLYTSPPSS
jgi:mercuric ion transport protein